MLGVGAGGFAAAAAAAAGGPDVALGATTLLTCRVRETFCRLPFNFHGRWLVAFA